MLRPHRLGQAAALICVAHRHVWWAAVLLVSTASGLLHGAAAPAEAEAGNVTAAGKKNRKQNNGTVSTVHEILTLALDMLGATVHAAHGRTALRAMTSHACHRQITGPQVHNQWSL
jgi:hypothetical protein